jgi:hypothetical protein
MNETQTVWLLRLTGAGTAIAGLLFLAPEALLRLLGIEVVGAGGLFFAQHWALLVACLGTLLMLAASRPALRAPVMTAALVEKAALIGMLLLNWGEPALAGLHAAVGFDGLCVLLYAVWLGRKPSTDR